MTVIFTAAVVRASCPHQQSGLVLFSSLANWNVAGSNLTLTSATKLDQSPGVVLNSITITEGASLIFDDAVLSLNVQYIRVNSGGKFIAGSADCPINNKITITFFGNRTKANIIGTDPYDGTAMGAKGLAILSNATLQLYGSLRHPMWTDLSETATQGSTTIKVRNSTQWQIGDKLVIASTDFGEVRDYRYLSAPSWIRGVMFPDQNEERTIVQVVDSKTFVLNQPLNYTHWASGFARAEVGLLNRNILIQGDDQGDLFGGHIMIRLADKCEISGIEVTQMGQQGIMGR